ncbi:monovalent cation/H+ antiporter subunit D [Agaricicola taiwanensis]|uniref:Monovalent cation/H+ antiporter subunit D n=1 Tax=Agaricicola taiwanensis TaxID=591372 RepID=A0A8J2YMT3_9RHOB|nr:monovalent cation/H+ antiporter subunit D [Agaricicola taiwanensis]GGE54247.1 monovalent cation/H+ antiporter subunit D [Agaricicola taiwanensis]
MGSAGHLVILPIILPLVAGAVLLLIDERRRALKASLSIIATVLVALTAFALLNIADLGSGGGAITSAYLLGNWPPPFSIVLVLDRLSALMLVLTALLALASLVFSLARWDRAGPHFHTLFQLLLMGLNGAFLTGDLFNLFVFFEVLLAASYGLMLHGSGAVRVKAGLHYIAINLVASFLFLIGIALVFNVTGTLNLADMAVKIPAVEPEDRALLHAGGAILGIAFLIKAGMWPLSFWLPNAYAAAAAPVAAIFAILSKVGVYVLLRLSLLLFGTEAGVSAGFGTNWLVTGGIATIIFGTVGVLASQAMGRLASYSVLVSTGTLLAVIGLADIEATSGALFYMVSSTLALSAFFLLVELVERSQDPVADVLAVTMEAYGQRFEDDDEKDDDVKEVGVAIPATLAVLGISFAACGLLIAGLPPLSGFIAKFILLSAVLGRGDMGGVTDVSTTSWIIITLLIISGLAAMISIVRAGIRTFWAPIEGVVPRVTVTEILPVGFLLALCLGMTIFGERVMRYTEAASISLHRPSGYIRDVLSTPPVPSSTGGGYVP